MACIIEDNNPADVIFGCTDPAALNYNSLATVDDSSCVYSGGTIVGCTDPLAINYNPLANSNDGDSCVYGDCPTEFIIRQTDGVVLYLGEPLTVADGFVEDLTQKTYLTRLQNIPLGEECCTEQIVGQTVIWDGEFCVKPKSGQCPYPLSNSLEGVVLGNNGSPVNQTCCNDLDYANWDPNFIINNNTKPGACIVTNEVIGDCTLSITDLVFTNDGSVMVENGFTFNTATTTNTLLSDDTDNIIDYDECILINSWEVTPVTGFINPTLGSVIDDSKTSITNPQTDYFIKLCTDDTRVLNLSVGQEIELSGFDITPLISTCYNISSIETLNGLTTIMSITQVPNSSNICLIISIRVTNSEGTNINCNTNNSVIDVSGSGVICPVYTDGEKYVFIPKIPQIPQIKGGLILDSVGDIPIIGTTPILNNVSQLCCEQLGNGLWKYIDGVCYWNPPKQTTTVSLGISENDIIVTDPRCDTLTVCMSVFLERPDNQDCIVQDGDIVATIGTYSGDSMDNQIYSVTNTSAGILNDDYCTWVQICGEINNFDGRPFKIKLNLNGVLDCCEYDIFVDDISVSCTVQDSIEVSTRNDCPGFNLRRVIDNKKSWVYNDGDVINRVFAPSPDADIPWRYTNYFEQSGVYEKHSKLVLNSKELALTFNMCSGFNCGSSGTTLTVLDLIKYKNNFQNFWVKFMEQFIPATTIFVSGEKWCNSTDHICEVINECGYNNNFSESTLGLKRYSGDNSGTQPNKSGNKNIPINLGGTTLEPTKEGDHGSSRTDDPIIFGNFVGSLLPYNPNETERELTFPKGLIPLLEVGMDNFRDKMKDPIKVLVK